MIWAVVVAQLEEGSLLISEIQCSNPNMGKVEIKCSNPNMGKVEIQCSNPNMGKVLPTNCIFN